MRRDRPISGSPFDWMSRAKGDLAIAKGPLPEGAFLEDLCFHAQQAAEKALKALYVYHSFVFRYTHDLDELLTGLKRHGIGIPPAVEESMVLTSYAWDARYPGVAEPVMEEEYQEAVRLAELVVEWVGQQLQGGSPSAGD